MNHTAALEHTAHCAGLAAHFKLYGYLLLAGVGSHYCFKSTGVSVVGKSLCKGLHTICDRLDRKHLTDNACGGYDNVLRVNAKLLCSKLAHHVCLLHAVCIAGVCVYGVHDNCSCLAVFEMLLSYKDRSALYLVCSVHCCCCTLCISYDKSKVVLLFRKSVICGSICCFCISERLVSKSALYSVCPEALSGTYSALNEFHVLYGFKFHGLFSFFSH